MSADGKPPGQWMRVGFALEATSNIASAAYLLLNTSEVLKGFAPPGATPDSMSISLAQWLGGAVLALTPPLLTTLPNTPNCIAQRPVAYHTLLAGELVFAPIMFWQLISRTEAQRGISDEAIIWSIGSLAPLAIWRIFALGWRPHWFGVPQDAVGSTKKNA